MYKKMYFADSYGFTKINVIIVVKETKKTFWTDSGISSRKETYDQKLCETFEEAKQWAIQREEIKVQKAKDALAYQETNLKRVWALEE